MPKLSIIIPVYNAAKYLSQCIDSVLAQTFTDFELVLVNDGSTDESEKICLSYKEQDTRIKYVYKENGGAASATRKTRPGSVQNNIIPRKQTREMPKVCFWG